MISRFWQQAVSGGPGCQHDSKWQIVFESKQIKEQVPEARGFICIELKPWEGRQGLVDAESQRPK